jgi:hypothetical protein
MAGSIRQRGKQSWEVRAFVGKDPVTGKKQYATKTIRGEKRDAEIALGRMLGEIEDGQYAVRAGTVGELCEKWFAEAEPDLSPSTGPEYRRLLDNRIIPRWGSTPPRRLRTSDLDLWYSELRRNGALRGGPLEPNSVKRIHSVLRRALQQGVRWGWITTNPAANATLPRAHKKPMELPPPADVALIIERSGEGEPVPTDLPAARGRNRRTPRRDVRAPVEARRLRAPALAHRARHRRWRRRPAHRQGHEDPPGTPRHARRGDR